MATAVSSKILVADKEIIFVEGYTYGYVYQLTLTHAHIGLTWIVSVHSNLV